MNFQFQFWNKNFKTVALVGKKFKNIEIRSAPVLITANNIYKTATCYLNIEKESL